MASSSPLPPEAVTWIANLPGLRPVTVDQLQVSGLDAFVGTFYVSLAAIVGHKLLNFSAAFICLTNYFHFCLSRSNSIRSEETVEQITEVKGCEE